MRKVPYTGLRWSAREKVEVDAPVRDVGVPPNGWFIRENIIKMDDVGVPNFRTKLGSGLNPRCWSTLSSHPSHFGVPNLLPNVFELQHDTFRLGRRVMSENGWCVTDGFSSKDGTTQALQKDYRPHSSELDSTGLLQARDQVWNGPSDQGTFHGLRTLSWPWDQHVCSDSVEEFCSSLRDDGIEEVGRDERCTWNSSEH